jgi:hypothetical protein
VRKQFNKALLAGMAVALVAATPAAARGLSFGPELVGIQAFETDWGPAADLSPRLAVHESDGGLLAELNFAREHPADYARALMNEPVSDWERGLADRPDPADLTEAVAFLQRQAPLSPLRADDQLAAAALEHVAAQGAAGQVGHAGQDGEAFDARLRRHGVDARLWGENIAYGPRRPRDVVRELIIDSGVPDRGHRRNIFLAAFDVAGASCGPHRDYAAMCVVDFASRGEPSAGATSPEPAAGSRWGSRR